MPKGSNTRSANRSKKRRRVKDNKQNNVGQNNIEARRVGVIVKEGEKQVKDEFLALFETAKALVTYIEKESVFDRAAAGGCSGMDFHMSDAFYDLIVNARAAIKDVENGREDAGTDEEAVSRLFEVTKALTTHVEKEPAFDKVNDMGPVGIDTCQSDAFVELIENTKKTLQEVEGGLL